MNLFINLKENKDLQRYQRDINDILEEKEHILSKEEENLLSNYQEVKQILKNLSSINISNHQVIFLTVLMKKKLLKL